ncbi:2-amino-5-formylamino-6-ribosylaminopyrimidin-4(3H)-one 5'-monophosphate deformylase [Methanosphaera sp. Vir-13MRS]|uniref:2-amino-5-formylamino-6-ribosylaminopyrimidin- 4(3H)-one 5'-monophosphate deformylase n=1 Tax=Candidatus Methanosphaera massiliense TaxID=3017187 RepID=UPI0023807209|nr:2-amino-5-formylamino-6-ribosylaminopyrimidin-4(3H)-one 5'-monophosphate deformylase [Candidatus Methanosphaera massiliense]MDE4077566.1 2-amino-5-formylamino-6-ribosylaminopyrimidin-4(3H)-one 5'-monophosphate deformylase [Candidatus Methanosphaera massiliense]
MNHDNFKLKYSSGNILSENIHEIGIIALGSHLENHGSALPIDTDSKIAANVAVNVATKTGAMFLGIFYAATEYDYVKHGIHLKKDDLIYKQIIPQLINIRKQLGIKKVIIVNGHGGNNQIIDDIPTISGKTALEIVFNNSIIEHEGPHACTGELSMGKVLGITDEDSITEHGDFNKNPEVGMVGLKLARETEPIIDEEAKTIEKEGFEVNEEFGRKLLINAEKSIIEDIKKLL